MTRGFVIVAGSLALFAAPAASAPPTISIQTRLQEAQPTVPFQVYGAVTNGQAGEDVIVESRDCGGYGVFSTTAHATTSGGGVWAATIQGLGVTSDLRARWRGGLSDTIRIEAHPWTILQGHGPGQFHVQVDGINRYFEGARGVFERLSDARWVRVRSFTLHRQNAMGVPWSTAQFAAHLKTGTIVRAVLPKTALGRCYLAGFSNTLRT